MDEAAIRKVARRLSIVAVLGMLVSTMGVFRGVQELQSPVEVESFGAEEPGNARLAAAQRSMLEGVVAAWAGYRPADMVIGAANVVLSGLLGVACLALFTLRPSASSLFTQAALSNGILALVAFGLWIAKVRAMVPVLRQHAAAIVRASAAGDPALQGPDTAQTAELFMAAAPWVGVAILFLLVVLELGFFYVAARAVRKDDVRALLAWAEEARQRDRDG